MYIKTFKLKQHTPIIHFQSGEKGATLRASEVKPKLDKFLIKKLGKDNIKKEWKRRDENGEIALDYGMSFVAKNAPEVSLPLSSYLDDSIKNQIIKKDDRINKILVNTAYFGNEEFIKTSGRGRDKHFDEARSYLNKVILAVKHKSVEGKIICFNYDLLKKILDNIPEFFFLHNFGTRQTKGFGSFSVDSIDNKQVSLNNQVFAQNNVKYCIKGGSYSHSISLIQRTHNLLKSGINVDFGRRKEYKKPKLFHYFTEEKNTRWDKRFIKKYINNNKINNKELFYKKKKPTDFYLDERKQTNYINSYDDDKRNKAPYKFVRALLGLAEQYEFLIDYNGKIDKKNKYIVNVEHQTDSDKPVEIKRFNSPILYKIIDDYIYVIPKEIPDYIFNAKFNFKVKLKKGSEEKRTTETIHIPKSTDFNLVSFLDYAFNNEIFKAKKIQTKTK